MSEFRIQPQASHYFTNTCILKIKGCAFNTPFTTYKTIAALFLKIFGPIFGIKVEAIKDSHNSFYYVDKETFNKFLDSVSRGTLNGRSSQENLNDVAKQAVVQVKKSSVVSPKATPCSAQSSKQFIFPQFVDCK